MTLRPTPPEERWLVLARRLRRSPTTATFAEHTDRWRTANQWSRCAFFVLGLVIAVMISIIASHLWPGAEIVIAGLVSLAAAEWLILGRRHFWSGIEEALARKAPVRSRRSVERASLVAALAEKEPNQKERKTEADGQAKRDHDTGSITAAVP